jgi:ribonuclease J
VNKIEIIPLGGIGEFGMNCMGIRYGDEMIVVDAGMGFPEETPYGVDISIPNFDFLDEYADDLTALILTHGHEDHIGALPYFLKKFNLPVYASRFTLALADKRLSEHRMMDDVLLHRVEANEVSRIGSFEIEYIHASHSLVDCFSLAIRTPVGTIIHTGDYKIDDTPVIGKPYDLKTLKKYGDEGVLLLLGDSTNATVAGRTPSEREVIPAFEEIFAAAEGRIIVSTFSSSLHRLQVVLDVAHAYDRKVCVLGRSMLKNVEIASDLGLLKVPHNTLIELGESRSLDSDQIVYLVTGSQGESRAALWNMASGSYKGLAIEKGDTVILSARIIPGNDRAISRLIGEIYKHGGNIIEEKRRLIHVSVTLRRKTSRLWSKPSARNTSSHSRRIPYAFPPQGIQKNHIAGYTDENVILIENGDVLEINEYLAQVVEHNDVGKAFIDEAASEEIDYEIVRERKKLGFSGLITLVVAVDKETKRLKGEPQITASGVAGINPLNGLLQNARQSIADVVEETERGKYQDKKFMAETLRVHLKQMIQRETGTKP